MAARPAVFERSIMKQGNTFKRWDLLPYQEALRPLRDQKVEFAVIATYSLDLPSLASALLALSRQDDDEANGTPVGLVTAVNRLRGRFRVLYVVVHGIRRHS
jgi:hypothetical protein